MKNRMEYLLDDIIIPSLGGKTGQKFINLVRVMEKSDDSLLKHVASKLVHNLHVLTVMIN